MPRLTRVSLLCSAALAARAIPLPAQQPGAAPVARPDTAAGPDSLARFLEAVRYRGLGPAAYSGRVAALAVPHGSTYPKTIYVGAAGGGVWKTTNGGTTWQAMSDGLGVETMGDLAVAPSATNLVWQGTGGKNSLRSR